MMWILLTIFAAFMQTLRNASQNKMSSSISTTGTTLARFIFAGPVVCVYLLGIYTFTDIAFALPDVSIAPYVLATAFFQIVATVLMVYLFKMQNYAVGAGLAKSEALAAALLGMTFFGSQISTIGLVGVFIGFIAVFVMSIRGKVSDLSPKTLLIGLMCGLSFAIASLMVRQATLNSGLEFPVSAAWALLLVIAIQVISLTLYLNLKEPETISKLLENKNATLLISVTSALSSIGWFSAMAIMEVAYVKTLGQIEVIFTIIIARIFMKNSTKKNDYIGLLLIGISSVLVMLPV